MRPLPRTEAPRAVLYLRQSTFREESISLEMQESAGREHAARAGYDVVAVESDPGISGRTWNRPAVQRVIAMVQDGDADVIVLWKWSRLSRSRLDWAVAADKVETAGGRIESATEPLDVSTSTGRLARGMLTEFAAFESERIGDVWKETHQRRIRNGLPANGKPRFGYSYTKAEGFLPDPVTGPVLRQTYLAYISGQSIYSLVSELNTGPTRPVSGYGRSGDGLWSDRTLRRVLDSGFAAGFITVKGEMIPGAHEPIIDAEEWEAFLEARNRRRTYRRVERSEYLLSGMVWCACGSKMNAGMYGAAGTPKFRCKDAHSKRTHAGGYVMETYLVATVVDWLESQQAAVRQASQLARNTAAPRAVTDPTAKLRSKIAELDRQLDTLTMRMVDGSIPNDVYVRLRDKLTEDKGAAEVAMRSVSVQAKVQPLIVIPALLEQWELMTIPERREILRSVIDRVVVKPGHPRAEIRVIPRGGITA